jgi:hypothetical protein
MSDIKRALTYDTEGSPVMLIYKKPSPVPTFRLIQPTIEAYAIPLDDAWMFSRDHYNPRALVKVFYGFDVAGQPIHGEANLTYDEAMFAKCNELCHQFDLGLITSRKMAEIASLIEDGIDDLVKMPPQAEKDRPRDIDGIVEEMKLI